MLVETVVFGGKNRLLHDSGNFVYADKRATLFSEFADQMAVRGIDAQRDLGAVVGEDFKRRQVGISEHDHDGEQRSRDRGNAEDDGERVEDDADGQRQWSQDGGCGINVARIIR